MENEKAKTFVEEIKVVAHELVDKVRELVHEGNVRRIIIKDTHGNTFVEIPVTVAAVGIVLAPVLSAVAAIATMAAKFTVVVEKVQRVGQPDAPQQPPAGASTA
jgi:hypothetical protein